MPPTPRAQHSRKINLRLPKALIHTLKRFHALNKFFLPFHDREKAVNTLYVPLKRMEFQQFQGRSQKAKQSFDLKFKQKKKSCLKNDLPAISKKES